MRLPIILCLCFLSVVRIPQSMRGQSVRLPQSGALERERQQLAKNRTVISSLSFACFRVVRLLFSFRPRCSKQHKPLQFLSQHADALHSHVTNSNDMQRSNGFIDSRPHTLRCAEIVSLEKYEEGRKLIWISSTIWQIELSKKAPSWNAARIDTLEDINLYKEKSINEINITGDRRVLKQICQNLSVGKRRRFHRSSVRRLWEIVSGFAPIIRVYYIVLRIDLAMGHEPPDNLVESFINFEKKKLRKYCARKNMLKFRDTSQYQCGQNDCLFSLSRVL